MGRWLTYEFKLPKCSRNLADLHMLTQSPIFMLVTIKQMVRPNPRTESTWPHRFAGTAPYPHLSVDPAVQIAKPPAADLSSAKPIMSRLQSFTGQERGCHEPAYQLFGRITLRLFLRIVRRVNVKDTSRYPSLGGYARGMTKICAKNRGTQNAIKSERGSLKYNPENHRLNSVHFEKPRCGSAPSACQCSPPQGELHALLSASREPVPWHGQGKGSNLQPLRRSIMISIGLVLRMEVNGTHSVSVVKHILCPENGTPTWASLWFPFSANGGAATEDPAKR